MTKIRNRHKQPNVNLGQLDRRSWELLILNLGVTGLLALGIAAFFYPVIIWHMYVLDARVIAVLPQLIIGLLSLMILEVSYIIQKQRELSELRALLVTTLGDVSTVFLAADYPKDPLTGVLDRRSLPDLLEREVAWVDRYRIPLSFVVLDIRDFSKLNEKQGNMAGDLVLKDFAQAVQTTMRQTDSVLRYGADEFLCLLPRTAAAGGAAFTRRVRQACQRSARLRELVVDTGLAVYTAGNDVNVILANAERDLAVQKAAPPASGDTAPQPGPPPS
jgi:diguanylate cyclase (GGDEF)-like protein